MIRRYIMFWGLIKLIILGLLVTAGVVIYEDLESNEQQFSQNSSGPVSVAAERPSTNTYDTHSNPDIGAANNYSNYGNTNCNDLTRLNTRMRNAYNTYKNSGKQWDYDTYYKAKMDLDALKSKCY